MLLQYLWWLTDIVALLLLVQALRVNLFQKYFFFYFYLLHVLVLSILRNYYITSFGLDAYRSFYWKSQFVSVAWGYSVIWEMYRKILAKYPGSLKLARTALGLMLPIMIFTAIALRGEDLNSFWQHEATVVDLERYIRLLQMVLLLVLLFIAKYSMVPIGRNLHGITLGYGIYIAIGVINDTVRSLRGDAFQLWWGWLQRISWLVVLTIWCIYLSSNESEAGFGESDHADRNPGRDYESSVEGTISAISNALPVQSSAGNPKDKRGLWNAN